eukprot:6164635-Prymnesium_polylepis.1
MTAHALPSGAKDARRRLHESTHSTRPLCSRQSAVGTSSSPCRRPALQLAPLRADGARPRVADGGGDGGRRRRGLEPGG